ncbi:MAG: hypothetical protein WA985_10730 [Erythrobacter sp.]|uniref:hypothetical protein n=1 Tax=Erythrobacter sp. TaxID=1042 RepID=UPI003C726CE9
MNSKSMARQSGTILTMLVPLLALSACASLGFGEDRPYDDLEGEWTADLRPSLDDDPYTQDLEIVVDRDGEVSGRFYDSAILSGRAGRGQDRLCLSFRTSDNSGPYNHAACLEDEDLLVGQTWSEGRDFVLPWTATR